ncbi:MAG: hypothetical protein KAI84_19940 [Gammaproteobacteria bacterium]|nr:hypothetical protein [Gammaproteobacteria bacterium]
MNKILVLLVALLISSCSVSLDYKRVTIKELLPVGSTLRLTHMLNIPAESSFIYIAQGKVPPMKNYNTVDIYEPYCTFQLYDESSQARQIKPDQFEVTRIVEWERNFGSINYKDNAHANNRGSGFIKTSGDGGPSIVMYATIISLRSAMQPEVKEMVCGHWNDPHESEPLTFEEMKSALGDLIMIDSTDNKNVKRDRTKLI